MHTNDSFSQCNPIINFIFYIGAILLGMFFTHPAYVASSVIFSAAYYISVRKSRALKGIGGFFALFVVLSVINPLFNTLGEHVLFTFAGGRPYTLEALFYGAANAGMVVSVFLWFCSYNEVMSSDKFLYIFGRFAPAVSLLLTMVLRLVPSYERKTQQIASARKCVGKAGDGEKRSEKIAGALTVLGSLTSWALEGAIITADSMRSRGYGCGKRTSFSVYSFGAKDKGLAIFMVVLFSFTAYAALRGAAYAAFTPVLEIAPINTPVSICAIAAYSLFLALPTLLNIKESVTWSILIKRS